MTKNVLIIKSEKASKSVGLLVDEVKKQGHNPVVLEDHEAYLHLSSKKGNGKIYLKSKETRLYSKEIDTVIPRFTDSKHGRDLVRFLAMNMGKFTTTTAEGIDICADKFTTAQILDYHNIPIPDQMLTQKIKEQQSQEAINKVGGLPIILKSCGGAAGEGVCFADSPFSAGMFIENLSKNAKKENSNLVLQRFIDTRDEKQKASDYRVFIVDGRVIAAMKRYSPEKRIRANYTISSEGEPVKLTNEQTDLALKAAAACKSLGVCGVDILEDKEGNNYILECNSNPGLKIQEVTGVDIVKEIVALAIRGKLSDHSVKLYEKNGVYASHIKAMHGDYLRTGISRFLNQNMYQ